MALAVHHLLARNFINISVEEDKIVRVAMTIGVREEMFNKEVVLSEVVLVVWNMDKWEDMDLALIEEEWEIDLICLELIVKVADQWL